MASKQRKAGKATVLGIATALLPWAIQQATLGNYATAAVGGVFGVVALVAYVHADDLDKVGVSADELKNLSEAAGDEIRERTGK